VASEFSNAARSTSGRPFVAMMCEKRTFAS
jgi:hypothetical protein